ncbi:MAG: iron export ABC transporter permease subunit FetB [Alphaproteobacteria bacterium]|nr:iron export ABC transporter permease subunit FetB [Alphaproteobacteria bacterium]
MSEYHALAYTDLVLASVLVLANAGLSAALGLGVARQMLIAAARMIVQLLLVGLILQWLFTVASPAITALAAMIMIGFATYEVSARQERRLTGWWTQGLGGSTMLLAGGLVTVAALVVVVRSEPWYAPNIAIPLFGMILGNAMTGTSLALNTLIVTVRREARAIEAQLLLGETRWCACRPPIRHALRSGFMPIVNAMAATGVVSLPGMMTGQILAGAAPGEAVKYQLLIMFLIAGTTGLAVIGSVYGAVLRLTDDRHRLRLDRLAESPVTGRSA